MGGACSRPVAEQAAGGSGSREGSAHDSDVASVDGRGDEAVVPAARPPSPARRPKGSPGQAEASPPAASRLRWQRGELLGTGAFGRVYLGLNEETGELLAVKEVLLSGTSREKKATHLAELQSEVALLRNLRHPNIVRYIGTECTPQALHIFLEFVPGGSIAGLLSKFGAFAERVVSVYTRQILEGLQYLHAHGIAHRDIKGANLLVDNAGCVKLADFGASRQLAELATAEGGLRSMRGTPYWMAPEVIKQTGHGRQADIWSVGCTAVEMVTAKPPWSEFTTQASALFHIASSPGPPPLPPALSPAARDFMLLCFNRVPSERPNATRLLRHPFVAEAAPAPSPRRPAAPPPATPAPETAATPLSSGSALSASDPPSVSPPGPRRLLLEADGPPGSLPTPGGASPELPPAPGADTPPTASLAAAFNPMRQPSLPATTADSPPVPALRVRAPAEGSPIARAVAAHEAAAAAAARPSRPVPASGSPPASTIRALAARAEQESVAARESARLALQRSKQEQWERELQAELEEQRRALSLRSLR